MLDLTPMVTPMADGGTKDADEIVYVPPMAAIANAIVNTTGQSKGSPLRRRSSIGKSLSLISKAPPTYADCVYPFLHNPT